MKTKFLLTVIIAFATMASLSNAQEPFLVELRHIYPEEIKVTGFELASDREVEVEAVGLHHKSRRREFVLGTAWIINAETREVAWQFEPESERRRRFDIQEQSKTIRLPRGRYEVYYASYPSYNRHDWGHDFGDFLSGLFDKAFDRDFDTNNIDKYEEMFREFRITVRGEGRRLDENEVERFQEELRTEAILSIAANGNDLYKRQGFELKRPMELQIYALGEGQRHDDFDYGWIINTETRERVWRLDSWDSEPAGGAEKNRKVNQVISLPKGKYAAIFVTDDSHSPQKWNSSPPFDPAFWGITIRAANPEDKRFVEIYEYEGFIEKNSVLSFTRMRNDEFASKGFTLKKPMKLQVYALGEGRDGVMYDYGWIVDAKSHKKVWVMNYDDSEHAGGGHKNRMIDNLIELDKGNYVAYFVTDGSHSFRDWNTSPPYDQERWGMTLVSAEENFNKNDVAEYAEEDDPATLARLVRVRDDDHKRATFTLKKDGNVRVYALGEGTRGQMHDYGWIEEARTGRIIWEMTYRKTEHAGGGKKNRLFDDTVFLKAGEYRVYYQSDGSHSFNDWNSDPPRDPINWGITVYLVNEW